MTFSDDDDDDDDDDMQRLSDLRPQRADVAI